jgi:serine/threonine protein kinase
MIVTERPEEVQKSIVVFRNAARVRAECEAGGASYLERSAYERIHGSRSHRFKALGMGSTGCVIAGRARACGKQVAIKTIRLDVDDGLAIVSAHEKDLADTPVTSPFPPRLASRRRSSEDDDDDDVSSLEWFESSSSCAAATNHSPFFPPPLPAQVMMTTTRIPSVVAAEVEALLSIASPHVITLLGVELSSTRVYLARPRCRKSLHDVIDEGILGPLGMSTREATILRWTLHLLRGIEACHFAGVVHRDIKPMNILIDASDTLVLCDFGNALLGPTPQTPFNSTTCDRSTTLWYRPPEAMGGGEYDCRVDLWSAGCVVWEMSSASGRPLFGTASCDSEPLTLIEIFTALGLPLEDSKAWRKTWGAHSVYAAKCPVVPLPIPGSDDVPVSLRPLVSALISYDHRRPTAAGAIKLFPELHFPFGANEF